MITGSSCVIAGLLWLYSGDAFVDVTHYSCNDVTIEVVNSLVVVHDSGADYVLGRRTLGPGWVPFHYNEGSGTIYILDDVALRLTYVDKQTGIPATR